MNLMILGIDLGKDSCSAAGQSLERSGVPQEDEI
jgi:hypothetical protein